VKPRLSCGGNLCLGGGDAGVGARHGCLIHRLGLLVGVQLALRDGVSFCKRRVARHVDAGEIKLRLRLADLASGLGKLTFGLINQCLEGPRVDLEENLAFVDGAAFLVILTDEVAGNLRLDLGVDEAVGGGDPLAGERDVLLAGGGDLDGQWAHGWLRRGAGLAAAQESEKDQRGRGKNGIQGYGHYVCTGRVFVKAHKATSKKNGETDALKTYTYVYMLKWCSWVQKNEGTT
jgi:hypothetical protein